MEKCWPLNFNVMFYLQILVNIVKSRQNCEILEIFKEILSS